MLPSEFSLIARYFSSLGRGPGVELGVGDDCALLALEADEHLATSVDTLVCGVHFPEDAFPEDIGFRCVAVAVSDLAAMGARPVGMTLALTLPSPDEFWLNAFSNGIAQASSRFGIPLVGGDTTRGPLTISVQVMGAVPRGRELRREGAREGDDVYVSGTLGDAAAALALFSGNWTGDAEQGDYLWSRFYRPDIPLELGQALVGKATAMIDISDGLLADLGHIAAASGLGATIEPSLLPLSAAVSSHGDTGQALRWALTGGDDYQLCFTLGSTEPAPEGCTRIGQVHAGEGVDCGLEIDSAPGYRHF